MLSLANASSLSVLAKKVKNEMSITRKNVRSIYRALCNQLCELKDDDIMIDSGGMLNVMSVKESIGQAALRCKLPNKTEYIEVPAINNKIIENSITNSSLEFDNDGVYLTPKQFSQIFNVDEDLVLVWICKALVKSCLNGDVGYYTSYSTWHTAISKISCLEEIILNDALFPASSRAA